MYFKKTMCRIQDNEVQVPCIRLDDVIFRSDAHQCLQTSNCSRLHPSERNGKSSDHFSEFEKNPAFKCIRPNGVAIPSRRLSLFDK
jgi:hypothetical protein